MFSAINVYASASAHSINMFPPLAKNPVSIPGSIMCTGLIGVKGHTQTNVVTVLNSGVYNLQQPHTAACTYILCTNLGTIVH